MLKSHLSAYGHKPVGPTNASTHATLPMRKITCVLKLFQERPKLSVRKSRFQFLWNHRNSCTTVGIKGAMKKKKYFWVVFLSFELCLNTARVKERPKQETYSFSQGKEWKEEKHENACRKPSDMKWNSTISTALATLTQSWVMTLFNCHRRTVRGLRQMFHQLHSKMFPGLCRQWFGGGAIAPLLQGR